MQIKKTEGFIMSIKYSTNPCIKKGLSKRKRWIGSVLVAIVLVIANTIPMAAVSVYAMGPRDRIVATVNGRRIFASDIIFRMGQAEHQLADEYFELFPDDSDFDHDRTFRDDQTFGDAVREEAVRIAALVIMVQEYAALHDIAVSNDDIDAINELVADWVTHLGAQEATRQLQEEGIIGGIERLTEMLMIDALIATVVESIINSPEKFAIFEQYMPEEEVLEEEVLGAKHILLISENFSSEQQLERTAQGILERALAGEDFDLLISVYGQDPGMEVNPEGYTFTRDVMVAEFEEAVLDLEIGEISGLVTSYFGIHIIMRIEPNLHGEIMRPWNTPQPPTHEERMMRAVFNGFEAKRDNADIVFRPTLNNVAIHPN